MDHQYRDSQNGYRVRKGKDGQYQYEHWDVWEAHNCPIPSGYVIHHLNGNKRDNRIENLQCLPDSEHKSLHSSRPENIAQLLAVRNGEEHEVVCENCGAKRMSVSRVQVHCSRKCAVQASNRRLSKRRLEERRAKRALTNV